MHKQVTVFILTLAVSLVSFGATTSSRSNVRKVYRSSTTSGVRLRPSPWSAQGDWSFGSIVYTGTLYSGNKTNFTTLRPAVMRDLGTDWTAGLSLPINWMIESTGQSTRVIGRPLLRTQHIMSKTDASLWNLNLGLKPPVFDTSAGGAEFYRAWQISAGIDVTSSIGTSIYSWNAGTQLSQDSKNTSTFGPIDDQGTTGTLGLQQAPVLRLRAGVEAHQGVLQYGLSLHTVNGIGVGDYRLFVQDIADLRQDFTPVDIMYAQIGARYQLNQNGSIHGSILRSLKSIEGKNFESLMATYDDLNELATLAMTVGYIQQF